MKAACAECQATVASDVDLDCCDVCGVADLCPTCIDVCNSNHLEHDYSDTEDDA